MKLKFSGFPHCDHYKGAGVHVTKGQVCEVDGLQGERMLATFGKAFAKSNAKADVVAPPQRKPRIQAIATLSGEAEKAEKTED